MWSIDEDQRTSLNQSTKESEQSMHETQPRPSLVKPHINLKRARVALKRFICLSVEQNYQRLGQLGEARERVQSELIWSHRGQNEASGAHVYSCGDEHISEDAPAH